jgi:hypothetical protein
VSKVLFLFSLGRLLGILVKSSLVLNGTSSKNRTAPRKIQGIMNLIIEISAVIVFIP